MTAVSAQALVLIRRLRSESRFSAAPRQCSGPWLRVSSDSADDQGRYGVVGDGEPRRIEIRLEVAGSIARQFESQVVALVLNPIPLTGSIEGDVTGNVAGVSG